MTDTSLATTTLRIEGMTCAGCATRVEKALAAVPGVRGASVNLATETAVVQGTADTDALTRAVADAGYTAHDKDAGPDTAVTLALTGMTCGGCAQTIEKALRAVPGVASASVNLATEKATVEGDDLDTAALVKAVEDAGYGASVEAAPETGASDTREKIILIGAGLLTLPLVAQMVAGWLGLTFSLTAGTQLALALPVQVIAGARFYTGAWKALRHGTANMDVLVALGTTAAFAYSLAITAQTGLGAHGHLYYEAAAVIITLIRLGKYLEDRARRATTASIRTLMNLAPETAHVIDGDEITDMPAAQVKTGMRVLVRPGERVPVDGEITEGESEIDESMVTGESVPVAKGRRDTVTGGTINGAGLLTVETTAAGKDAVVARMAKLVEAAQAAKPPMQKVADRVAAIFVPVVIVIAIVTFGAWLALGGTLASAVGASVAVLVVACPCALGLATPAAIAAGTGAAARAGILIRDTDALERAHGLTRIYFDKTGTLTRGEPAVTDFIAAPGADERDVLAFAAAAQTGSEHPLARAVLAHASNEGIAATRPDSFRNITGRGLEAKVHGHDVVIGSPALMRERGLSVGDLAAEGERLSAATRTVTYVAIDGEVKGLMAMADPVRDGAAEAIAALGRRGIESVLLTGDAKPIAEAVARKLGIAQVRAEVKPEDKSKVVGEAAARGAVGMVGDGVNDAPALAAADLSIAMGSGSAAALETAAITLMRPEPGLVAGAIDIAESTRRKVRQNLFWAFAYNVALIPVAAFGLLNPAVAGGAMALSSLSVLGNSLLLARWRPRAVTATLRETRGPEPAAIPAGAPAQ